MIYSDIPPLRLAGDTTLPVSDRSIGISAVGGDFNYAMNQTLSVFGDANGEFRNGQTSMNSTLGLRYVF